MVSSRKRARGELEPEVDAPEVHNEPSLLQRIRDTWQLANVFEWIYLFGKVVKIDESIDIEVGEALHSGEAATNSLDTNMLPSVKGLGSGMSQTKITCASRHRPVTA